MDSSMKLGRLHWHHWHDIGSIYLQEHKCATPARIRKELRRCCKCGRQEAGDNFLDGWCCYEVIKKHE